MKHESPDDYMKWVIAEGALSKVNEWDKWRMEVPFINFPSCLEVRVIPPFGGAIVRFVVRHIDFPETETRSVYLDCYGRLGAVDEPYWELYPHYGDTYRCAMNETNDLIAAILDSYSEEAMIRLEERRAEADAEYMREAFDD